MKKGTRITYYVDSLGYWNGEDILTCKYCNQSYRREDHHNFDDCVSDCREIILDLNDKKRRLKSQLESCQLELKISRKKLNKAKKIKAESWWKIPLAIDKLVESARK